MKQVEWEEVRGGENWHSAQNNSCPRAAESRAHSALNVASSWSTLRLSGPAPAAHS